MCLFRVWDLSGHILLRARPDQETVILVVVEVKREVGANCDQV